ncbi:MAG: aminotransferase class I/II-fold pyridoxal phosphate-dependent enzyme [Gemmatimonadota bacterium]
MSDFDPIESLADMRHEFGEHGGVNMSIETSTTFTVMQADTLPEIFGGAKGPEEGGCFLYGRHFNPTVYVLGKQIAALEGAGGGYCTASGMGAISSTLMQLCDHGDHVVASTTVYGGTFALLNDFLPAKAGIRTTFADTSDLASLAGAFTPRTKVLYVESIANPTLRVADIPRLADLAHAHGAKLVVDNTFSPLTLSPLRLGADVVVHSLTKFMNGASDYIGGAICASEEFIMDLMDLHLGSLMLLGPTMDPRAAFDISMRLPHLGLRVVEHGRRALMFAERLEAAGLEVIYPGLPGHPDHELFNELRKAEFGYGGIVCLDLGSQRRAEEFMEVLQNRDRFGFMAVSLGYFDTLMSCSGSTTSSEMTEEEQRAADIRPGLVRMSIGYTGTPEQRWAQLEDALEVLNLISVGAG